MKILIIGNDPHDIGGVVNYTRPLAHKFVELKNEVFYFYSGAWNRQYDWRLIPYLRINRKDFPFECAELINSPCWPTNFGNPDIDVSEAATEKIFGSYLDRVKPDVVHIHSRLGLPASLLQCANNRNIPVFNTVHVYGMLCQKRVMIDHLGEPCGGPSNLSKCVECTGSLHTRKLRLNARLGNISRTLLDGLVLAKRLLKGASVPDSVRKVNQPSGPILGDCERVDGLARRHDYMVHLMNTIITRTICVSEDVKNTLMRYGVHENRLLVQHIGSLIADTQKPRSFHLHAPLVIGNIGGVYHYKGTHVLIDAIARMKSRGFRVIIFGKYENAYKEELMRGREDLPIEFTGRYVPEQLPGLLEQIDVMVLPSICNDTAPQTIFESYSRYVPIVASQIGGFPDFVEDGVNGRLFRPGDSDHLAMILDDIVTNPQCLKSFTNHIPKMKNIRENAEELLSLFSTL
jgi:glycosyltransferase involved in cell wall biosynthesis